MSKSLLKSEWEVLREQLKSEKNVLKALEEHYTAALKDIESRIASMLGRQDANLPHVIRRIEYQQMVKAQVQAALDKLHANEYETISEYLKESYTDAFVGSVYTLHQQGMPVIIPIDQSVVAKAVTIDSRLKTDLYRELGVDVNRLKKSIASEITRGFASNLMYSEIARNIRNASNIPLGRAKTIARTEAGRVQEQATFDAAQEAKAVGADVVKQWSSFRDGKTRDSHRALDGQICEVNEPFTVNGHKAMHPHGFGVAAEDINCRCTMLTRARSAIDEDDLKLMEERAAAHKLLVKDVKGFEDAKAKDFADFKKKYLKAVEAETETTQSEEPQIQPKQKEQEKPKQSEPKLEEKQPAVSIEQENQRGSNAIIETYEKRLRETGVKLISAEELAKINTVDYGDVDPRAAEACNLVLEKYAGRYNSWVAGVKADFGIDENLGGKAVISSAGGTAFIELNGKQMKDYDRMVEMIRRNGLEGHGVKVKPEYYDQYVMTHEYAHTLLYEGMAQKSNVGVDHTVYKKAMKEAKQVFAEYKQEFRDLNNRVIALRNEEVRLNDAYMDDDADILDLMARGKKLVADLKEAEEQLASVTISRYANTNVNEFIAEAWAEREIGENPGKYSKRIGSIIDKYFKLETPQTLEKQGKSGIIKADKIISGHASTPKMAEPNTVIDHVDENGSVDARGFYGDDGYKGKDIHTTDHGNPKRHPYGKHGEHAHDYTWDDDGRLKEKTTRNLDDDEKERNGDIL